MTTVVSSEHTRRRYQWTVPAPYPRGAVIGDVQDAIGMAASTYEAVTGGRTTSDDWLRVDVGDEEVVFWFEVDEEPGKALPPDARRGLRSLVSILEEGLHRTGNIDGPALIEALKSILRGESGGAA
jgi:hypothetical protein